MLYFYFGCRFIYLQNYGKLHLFLFIYLFIYLFKILEAMETFFVCLFVFEENYG